MGNKSIIIGIAGASGSGKSLLSNTIINELGSSRVIVISEDSYYKDGSSLTMEEREKVNYDHPDSLDHDLIIKHLKKLQAGESIEVPTYDFAKHLRTKETRTIGNHTIVVIEGILLFVDSRLREQMDIRIFMDTPPDICLIRRIIRDIKERGRTLDSVLTQYKETVRPMYLQFIEPSKRYADIIVPKGGANRIAIDVIKAKMRELLGNNNV